MLRSGADWDAIDSQGHTAFFHAVAHYRFKVVQTFLAVLKASREALLLKPLPNDCSVSTQHPFTDTPRWLVCWCRPDARRSCTKPRRAGDPAFICLSVCLCLSVCVCVCLCLPPPPPLSPPPPSLPLSSLSVCLPACLPVHPPVVCLSARLSVRRLVLVSVCRSLVCR